MIYSFILYPENQPLTQHLSSDGRSIDHVGFLNDSLVWAYGMGLIDLYNINSETYVNKVELPLEMSQDIDKNDNGFYGMDLRDTIAYIKNFTLNVENLSLVEVDTVAQFMFDNNMAVSDRIADVLKVKNNLWFIRIWSGETSILNTNSGEQQSFMLPHSGEVSENRTYFDEYSYDSNFMNAMSSTVIADSIVAILREVDWKNGSFADDIISEEVDGNFFRKKIDLYTPNGDLAGSFHVSKSVTEINYHNNKLYVNHYGDNKVYTYNTDSILVSTSILSGKY